MNTFGIDYQGTTTTIIIREGQGAIAKLRAIGDGTRQVIPTAVWEGGLWGSAAVMSGGDAAYRVPSPLTGSGAVDGAASDAFWRGLVGRLRSFLGRMAPVAENGYCVVVSLADAPDPEALAHLDRACHRAGLVHPTFIRSADALLARWLAERAGSEAEQVLLAVAVGDASLMLRAYRVAAEAGRPRVVVAGTPMVLPQVGHAFWSAELLRQVVERTIAPLSSAPTLMVCDAALEFGARLGRVAPDVVLTFTGPFQRQMLASLRLSRRECAAWPQVAVMSLRFPKLIQQALAELDATAADQVLVGGIGAVWPFPYDALSEVVAPQTIWQSGDPLGDVAYGAAWWSELVALHDLELHVDADALMHVENGADPEVTSQTRLDMTLVHPDERPPWDRDYLSLLERTHKR